MAGIKNYSTLTYVNAKTVKVVQKLILRILQSRLYIIGQLIVDSLHNKLLNIELMLMQMPAIVAAVQMLNLGL